MKLLLTILLAVLASAGAANAAVARWVPGTNYLISETDANNALERGYDHAYCTGVPRFGHRGEFPYEEFVVFDCSISINRTYCSDQRYKAIKGSRPGYFRLKLMRRGDCF